VVMWRRWITCGVAAAMGCAMSAESWGKPMRVVTSFYPMYIHSLNVAHDVPGVEIINLTAQAAGCLHDYQLSPDDLVRLSRADVLVVNGAGMESFLDRVVRQAPGVKVINASEGISLLGANSHVWLSVSLAMCQVQNIAAGLAAIDPDHAAAYAANAEAYGKRLDALRRSMQAGLKDLKRRDIITLHEAFSYFAEDFGLNIVGVIQREAGTAPGAKELAATIRLARASGVKALFAEPQYPRSSADVIAAETGAKVYLLDPVVSGAKNADAYIRAMEENLRVLKEALGS
jgi:zinc transport system substrate-binding protein